MANGLDTNADPEENPEYIKNLVDHFIIVHGEIAMTPSYWPEIAY